MPTQACSIPGGAATCSEGFVVSFLKVPLACWGSSVAAVQPNNLGNSQKTYFKTSRIKWPPHLVLRFKFTADLRTFSYLATVPEVPVNHCRQSESPLKGSNIWKCLSPYYLIDRNCTALFIHSVAMFCYGCRQKLRGSAWGDQ